MWFPRRSFALTSRALLTASLSLATLLSARAALAQAEPKFTFAKPDEVKPQAPPVPPIEWKVQAKGGFNLTSGNSQTTNVTAGLIASRKQGNNKLGLEGGVAYGRSNINVATVGPDPAMMMPGTFVTGLTRQEVTTTNNWLSKGRYDRFFTTNNSGYVSAQAAADKIAGKTFAGGGQIGYSRQVVKTANNTLVAEIGYDFSYERYVQQPMKMIDPVSIHSARLFVGDTANITSATGASASVEAFFNLNKEDKALSIDPPHNPGVDAFHDTRVIGKLSVSTTLFKSLGVALGFSIRYDQNPAPLPPPATPANMGYLGIQPFAQTVDTTADMTLMYTFL